ncbi:E3 ubiquitin-protein ligase SHPRH-like isoform X2 [Montipora foliosa]|uniref:E3 ubiquitin-protein ligase SHPRH-like isoform X2 n=1 Tax=Montipora foliosa TaxID=591990 RepID=UPI0035F19EB9
MSGRKRKQKLPEKISEEKRAKMTWCMFDQAPFVCNGSDSLAALASPSPECQNEATCTRNRLGSKTLQTSETENLELRIENAFPKHCICQLGCFDIYLCTSKEQEDEIRMNGTNVSSPHLDKRDFDNINIITVRLAFLKQNFTATSSEIRDLRDQASCAQDEVDVDVLNQVSFKATVPCASENKLEALVYLQNKGVISLILNPEQGILKDRWEVLVCLHESGLSTPSFPSVEPTSRKIDKMMKILLAWFCESSMTTTSAPTNYGDLTVDKGFERLYDSIKIVREKATHPADAIEHFYADEEKQHDKKRCGSHNKPISLVVPDVQHPNLKPVLRGYQRNAVEWMLRRECGCGHGNQIGNKHPSTLLHPLWREIHSLDGKLLYFNPYTGRVTKECFPAPLLPLGGVLADEMGLGKTVEVIACILCHPKPSSKDKLVDQFITAHAKSTGMQTNGESPHSSYDPRSKDNSTVIYSTMTQDCKSQSNDAMMHSNLCSGSVNAREDLKYQQDNYCNSKKTECVISQERTSHASTQLNHKLLNHGETSDAYRRTDQMPAIPVKDCLNFQGAVTETMTIKCQCICGVTSANCSDKLLHCSDCQAVFHGKCLVYDCPKGFICPQCALKQEVVPSRATLIISPAPIAQQWIDEICRHTKSSSLKLLVYKGVAKSGFILPEVLADHDVILTTYTTLRSDFYHLGQGNVVERSMRYNKRYIALPSPLTGVLFWRICLDEAQMVESTTAKAAEVAVHLRSVHRWCVTGTPIQRDLSDIYGLLLFLGVDPYCNQTWWKTLLYEPYIQGNSQPLCNFLAKIMWRSAKRDVIHEIRLPDQDEKVKWLIFSPVEQHFYRRQHEECAGFAMRLLSHWKKTDTMLSTIDRHTVNQLLNPLLRLRQACCHPQAVRGGFLSMQKSTLTMDKLLENLISKAKLECEEAHRQLLFAFNGLAGIHILKQEWSDAVDMYREAMRSWMEHETTFRTDALQKLHTLYNLSDILSEHQEKCSRTLRDDKLQDEVRELRGNYTNRVNVQVAAAQENLNFVKSSIADMRKKIDFQSPWWMEALHYVSKRGLWEDLCHRIRDELSATDVEMGSIGRFADLHGLQYLLSSKIDFIKSTYQNLQVALDELNVMPSTQMVQASAECCLRPANNGHAKRCAFCEVDDIFTEYESRIFGHQGMKGVSEEVLQADEALDWHRHGNTGGLRAESDLEKVLKVIHNYIKNNKISPAAQQEGRHHLNLIEGLRKEFKVLRALWFALRERVSCFDELDMCTSRLRLQLPGEPFSDDIHVINPLQLDQQRLKFTSDRVVAQTELRKKIGQLLYLNNLAKTQTCHDGKNPDPCPVCVKQLGVQWSVFSCGHCICCQCAWVLLRQAGIGPRQRNVHVKCPLCRIPTVAQEISYVSTATSQTDTAHDSVTVKGSHSTKVEAIVRTLLTIRSADSTAKSLVFSTWQDVLAVIARALDENDIKYRHITGGNRHFQENLQTFKHDPDMGVLLLPLQTGSNGLNIIEATHVLLVEPALNPAHELQAVGRVHRIGQTRPTHVYRFIIRGTVESRMYSLLQSKPTSSVRTGARDSENSSLTLGDLASLFTQDDEKDDEQFTTGIFGPDCDEVSPERD